MVNYQQGNEQRQYDGNQDNIFPINEDIDNNEIYARKLSVEKEEADKKRKEAEAAKPKEGGNWTDPISKWSKDKTSWGPFFRYLAWGSAATTGILIFGALAATGLGLPMAVPIAAYVISNVYFSFKLYTKAPIHQQRKWERLDPTITEKATNKNRAQSFAEKVLLYDSKSTGRAISMSKNNEHHDFQKLDRERIAKAYTEATNPKSFTPNYEKFLNQVELDDVKGMGLKEKLVEWINNSPTLFSKSEKEAFKNKPFGEAFEGLRTRVKGLAVEIYRNMKFEKENVSHQRAIDMNRKVKSIVNREINI